MSYHVKDVFLTIQGEGAFSGHVAVFCRFIGCNLWSGLEKDRGSASCQFCDTDFIQPPTKQGGKFPNPQQLADHIESFWPQKEDLENDHSTTPFVVFTGGEPLLQLDKELIAEMHKRNFFIAVESNGTIVAPDHIDWLCVSPKRGCPLKQKHGHELKLVYPQSDLSPQEFEDLSFDRFSLQPMDIGKFYRDNVSKTIDYCFKHPKWSLSLQTHKILGIP